MFYRCDMQELTTQAFGTMGNSCALQLPTLYKSRYTILDRRLIFKFIFFSIFLY